MTAATPNRALRPILCAPLLRRVDRELVALLRSLEPSDWDAQTVAPQWKVRDVAAHLLDTQLRKLSLARDGWFVESPPAPGELATFIHRLNREGVTVFRRLSPTVLTALLERAGEESATFHEALDPFAPAAFAVSWAGEAESLNWFDTVRELTERWHHQQQIRLAIDPAGGGPGIMTRELYDPVLDAFLRGLPHSFRNVAAAEGTLLKIQVSGDAGGAWLLERDSRWTLVTSSTAMPSAEVTIPQEIAWRVFTKGIDKAAALAESRIEGDRALGERVFDLTAIVA
ncbi:MAG: hypothetical protein JWO19_2782 [Bryobacterales bacterium]|nr:hypothetical protein [Bryobacterales bacterium]